MLFISPPFGNYLNLPNTISINGATLISIFFFSLENKFIILF